MSHTTLKTVLLSGTAAVALVVAGAQSANAQIYTTSPGFYLSLEGRYMWNRGDKVGAFGPTDTPIVIDTSGPSARARNGWGGKAMLGYRFTGNWDLGFGLSGGWLHGKKSGTGFASDGASPTPATVATDTNIKVKLRYEVADFEAGYNFTMGQNTNARLFGGVRAARFRQTANAHLMGTDTLSGFDSVSGNRKTTYRGIGPRLGLNGQVGIGNSGFNIFGSISGAMLYGRFNDKHFAAAATPAGAATPGTSIQDERKKHWVPNAEGEIGVGYNFNPGSGGTNVGLQVGYRGEAWWRVSSDADVLTTAQASHRSDQMLHGPFVRLVAAFGAPAPAPMASVAPPPPPPPAATARKSFIVFFDFDRSNITAEGQRTINDAVAAAKSGNSTQISLTGHTDRSGSEQYNMALSMRRAEAVKAAMVRQGIPANSIVVVGRGESQNLVPTADGVREPQNRRVEIVI